MTDTVKMKVWVEAYGSGERVIEVDRRDIYVNGKLDEKAADAVAEHEQENMIGRGWEIVE